MLEGFPLKKPEDELTWQDGNVVNAEGKVVFESSRHSLSPDKNQQEEK